MLIIPVLRYLQMDVSEEQHSHLVTRPFSSQVREKIIRDVLSSPENVFQLDFSGVEIIDYSGADELVVKLTNRIVSGELGDRYFMICNLSLLHKDNITAAFNLNKKLAVIVFDTNGMYLIGNVKPMLIDVLKKVYNEGVDTARKLADLTGSEINLASTKLLQLYQQRLILRKEEFIPEGGRQFIYRPIIECTLNIE